MRADTRHCYDINKEKKVNSIREAAKKNYISTIKGRVIKEKRTILNFFSDGEVPTAIRLEGGGSRFNSTAIKKEKRKKKMRLPFSIIKTMLKNTDKVAIDGSNTGVQKLLIRKFQGSFALQIKRDQSNCSNKIPFLQYSF